MKVSKKKGEYRVVADKVYIVPIRPEDVAEPQFWQATWNIYTKDDDVLIGTVKYLAEPEMGTLPIWIEIDPYKRNQGYGKDALSAMTEWTFMQNNIYELTAQVEHVNEHAISIMERVGYVFRNGTKEIENYSITKQPSIWTGVYVCVGIFAGLAIGIVFGSMAIGLAAGVIVGVLLGGSMDAKEVKQREAVTGIKIKENRLFKQKDKKQK